MIDDLFCQNIDIKPLVGEFPWFEDIDSPKIFNIKPLTGEFPWFEDMIHQKYSISNL